MNPTRSRTRSLDDIAAEGGTFAIVAMDQRNTLRRMFTAVGREAARDSRQSAIGRPRWPRLVHQRIGDEREDHPHECRVGRRIQPHEDRIVALGMTFSWTFCGRCVETSRYRPNVRPSAALGTASWLNDTTRLPGWMARWCSGSSWTPRASRWWMCPPVASRHDAAQGVGSGRFG
jgi:hypothetical protein